MREFQRMVVKLDTGASLTREEQTRAARFALHRARLGRTTVDMEVADKIGRDLMRVVRDPRAVRLHFACALLDEDCTVLASFEGGTERLDAAEDLALAAIVDGGSGQIHVRPND